MFPVAYLEIGFGGGSRILFDRSSLDFDLFKSGAITKYRYVDEIPSSLE